MNRFTVHSLSKDHILIRRFMYPLFLVSLCTENPLWSPCEVKPWWWPSMAINTNSQETWSQVGGRVVIYSIKSPVNVVVDRLRLFTSKDCDLAIFQVIKMLLLLVIVKTTKRLQSGNPLWIMWSYHLLNKLKRPTTLDTAGGHQGHKLVVNLQQEGRI